MLRAIVPKSLGNKGQYLRCAVTGDPVVCKRGLKRWVPMIRPQRHRGPWWADSWPGTGLDNLIHDPFRETERVMNQLWKNAFDPPYYVRGLARTDVQLKYDDKVFQIELDVSDFAPEEIEVKISDNTLVIKGEHTDKEDKHGLVARQFLRQFAIPEDVDVDSFESLLNDDGSMIVKAQVNRPVPNERVIEIKKQQKETEDKKE
ncbi:protein lethal(2)essential for life [Lingula anatina]|uniref:Protein lethal(2)essential for life n=1 Tax=Lingula anatina TaxID=7574 RepID=A0A1S3JC25_LINAN|nr:protein lethal(2)essential for life [Lingula anatina]|eukprot:XP_013407878.1 protein lethal(2)essential for life [Lingula anatina]